MSADVETERAVFCGRCGLVDDRVLFADLGDRHACASCYQELGRPPSRPRSIDPSELFEHERRQRERMTRRGGTDRHLVRSGKA